MIGPVNVEAGDRLGLREAEGAEAERIDQRDALRAVGDVDRLRQVVQEDADDLAEAERHDREVVAAELERGRAEQHAEHAGDGAPIGRMTQNGRCRSKCGLASSAYT